MTRYANPLPQGTIDAMFGSWLAVIKRKECASIIYLPKFDREYRANQFIEWVKLQGERGMHVVPVSLQSLVTEDWDEIAKKLASLKHPTKYTVFLVTDADWLLVSAPHLISRFQSFVLSPYRSASFLFFFERNLLDTSCRTLAGNAPLFMQNSIAQPLYKKEDILHFLHHMEGLYGFKLPQRDIQHIWDECRGYIWLATEVLRHAHQTGKISFTHEAFIFRLRAIWEGLSEGDRRVLSEIVSGRPIDTDQAQTLAYFEKMGLVAVLGGKNTITVQVFERFIKEIVRKENQMKLGDDGHLYVGAIVIDSMLSEKEKAVISCLIRHQGETVSRETIARAIWGNDAAFDYSDWNLDQLISRLRKRLSKTGIPADFIKTVKGKGFCFLPKGGTYGVA